MNGKRKSTAAVAALLALVALVAIGLWIWMSRSLRSEVNRTIEKYERDSKGTLKATVGDISVNPLLRRATLRNVTFDFVRPQGSLVLRAETIEVKKWQRLQSGGDVLREQALAFRGVSSPQLDARLAQAPSALKQRLGDTLLFDASYSGSYRPEKQNELHTQLAISSKQIGDLSLDLTVSGVDLTRLTQLARDARARQAEAEFRQKLQAHGRELLAMVKIHGARLELRDAGLMGLLLAQKAAEEGTTPEGARQRMLAGLHGECDKPGAEPWMVQLCMPLISFVERPQSIRVVLAPRSPVAVADLPAQALTGGPKAVIERLGLVLAAN